MSRELLIFDFDGTICDTPQVALTIINEVAPEFGVSRISREQLSELKQKSYAEVMEAAGLSWRKLPAIIRKVRARFREHVDTVPLIGGMDEVIRDLHREGYRMGILTSNTRENVELFLRRHDLMCFEFIHTPRSMWGKHKILARLLRRYGLPPESVLMIGDEVRDIEAAKRCRVDAVAVSWGFNGEKLLRETQPWRLIQHPDELPGLMREKPGEWPAAARGFCAWIRKSI